MADNSDEGMTREGLARSLGEGIGALSLFKALMSNLRDKGILTEVDIEQIESNAAEFFAGDLQAISGESGRAEGHEFSKRRIAEAKCSICGEQATGFVEKASLNFDADRSNPFVEISFRCAAHMENTELGPDS
jgi:hypothetical protein